MSSPNRYFWGMSQKAKPVVDENEKHWECLKCGAYVYEGDWPWWHGKVEEHKRG